jgi:hypothetical protein
LEAAIFSEKTSGNRRAKGTSVARHQFGPSYLGVPIAQIKADRLRSSQELPNNADTKAALKMTLFGRRLTRRPAANPLAKI